MKKISFNKMEQINAGMNWCAFGTGVCFATIFIPNPIFGVACAVGAAYCSF